MKKVIKQGYKGQGLVEYALLLALIALVAALALDASGVSVSDVYRDTIATLRGDRVPAGEEPACIQTIEATGQWNPYKDGFGRGGVEYRNGRFQVCSLCGGTVPGSHGKDYTLTFSNVQVENVRKSWNGYGVLFRGTFEKKKYSGYMFEIERQNENKPTQVYFSKWVKGKQIRPLLSVLDLPSFDWENPPEIQVKVEGDTFTAYLDGKEVLRAKDDTYPDGSSGVISNPGTELKFGGFKVGMDLCGEVE